MIFKLSEKHRDFFLKKHESGMGYQCIEQFQYDGKKLKYIIFNAELLIPFDELEQIKEYTLSYELYDGFLAKKYSSLQSSDDIIDTQRVELRDRHSFLQSALGNKPKNPAQLLKGNTKDHEGFKRFSAYKNDRRITDKRGLLEGTYVTTVNDVGVVPSGLGAVARYALPNPWPAKYVFTVTPLGNTPLEYGTVQPAFHQSGGGVEVFFRMGTGANTVSNPYAIPER